MQFDGDCVLSLFERNTLFKNLNGQIATLTQIHNDIIHKTDDAR